MAGSAPDFEDLFHAEFAAIVRTVFLICHDYERAQDIAQDAFVKLVPRWDRVSRYDRPGAWVRRVAIRLAIRSARRETMRSRAEGAMPTGSHSHGVDVDVLKAIKGLSSQQRAAVVLFYFEDFPLTEIADLMGCSAATVRVHLYRARGRLATVLADQEVRS